MMKADDCLHHWTWARVRGSVMVMDNGEGMKMANIVAPWLDLCVIVALCAMLFTAFSEFQARAVKQEWSKHVK